MNPPAPARFLLPLLLLLAGTPLPLPAASAWRQLASLPDAVGFAGPFAGVSGGALVVAGGANFPGAKPWEGGQKIWHDDVFVLEDPDGDWRRAGRLPAPLGYGVAVTHRWGLICVGGSDAQRHHTNAFFLHWKRGRLEQESLPPLPEPAANLSGALVGDTLIVAGGTATPDSTSALQTAWSLDLTARRWFWKALPPLPGPGRMLATAGSHDGVFYLVGGAALRAGPDGKPVRDWLRDAWRFTPREGWSRLADLPRPVVAAPSPAPVVRGRLLLLGGDDGAQAGNPPTQHRGFPRGTLAYEPKADRWLAAGELPFSLVTTVAVPWNKDLIIPGGELRPGLRATAVWAGRPANFPIPIWTPVPPAHVLAPARVNPLP